MRFGAMRGRDQEKCPDSDDVLDMIKDLKDIAPSVIGVLQKSHEDKIPLRMKVEPEELAEIEKKFDGENQPSFEYFAQSKEIVVLSPPTLIHQHVQFAIEGWFNDVGEELSDAVFPQ